MREKIGQNNQFTADWSYHFDKLFAFSFLYLLFFNFSNKLYKSRLFIDKNFGKNCTYLFAWSDHLLKCEGRTDPNAARFRTVITGLIWNEMRKVALELKEIAKNIMTSCLAVKAGESLLVVTDDSRRDIGCAIYEGAKDLGCEAMLLVMEARKINGEEPPKIVAEAMKAADVVICPTAQSLTHTNARMEAAKAGARIVTMPGITEAMFHAGAMTADYGEVEKLTAKIADLLTKASTATVEKNACRLTLDLKGRNGIASSGIYQEPGKCGNLPSGEAYIAPIETGSNGETLIDGSMVSIGKLSSPLHAIIKNGKLQSISGEKSELLQVLLKNERNATVCELGIGTNKAAILNGAILEDEKVYGTVHIAFGTNSSFGGTNTAECHMDGIILQPTLYLDDTLVIEKGIFVI